MDNEILKPSEELESNAPASPETSTDETTIEVPVQSETLAPAEEEIPGAEETFEQGAETPLDEDTPAPSAPSVEEETLFPLTAGEIAFETMEEILPEITGPTEDAIAEIVAEAAAEELPAQEEAASEEFADASDPEEEAPAESIEDERVKEPANEDKEPDTETASPKTSHFPDFSALGAEEIISNMKMLIDSHPVNHLRILDSLPALFEAQFQKEQEQARAEQKTAADDFPNDTRERFNSIYRIYKEKRSAYYKKSEEEKEENLQIKLQIIEELKELIQKEESLDKTFTEFRNLQERWRNTGIVPQAQFNDLMKTYHLHVENFYNYIKINRELRDLDLKKNLDSKIALCEQAERLIEENDPERAIRQLGRLRAEWREIGPVPFDQMEMLRERFKEASNKISKAYKGFYSALKEEQENNLKIMESICTRTEALVAISPASMAEWGKLAEQVIGLQEEWKSVGAAPQKERKKLYKRFRDACDAFFSNKRELYRRLQEERENNLKLKIALCEKVEALQDSTEWGSTAEKIKSLQQEWREIGNVPQKQSDKIWLRFRTACDAFFKRKVAVRTDQRHNLALKKALIREVRDYVLSGNNEQDMAALNNFQTRWSEIGFVPVRDKEAVQTTFRELIDGLFEKAGISEFDRDLERFKSRVNTLEASGEAKEIKIIHERERLVNKIRQLEADLHVWENNIGFFSKSKNSEEYIKEFSSKIEEARRTLALMQEKLKVIDDMI